MGGTVPPRIRTANRTDMSRARKLGRPIGRLNESRRIDPAGRERRNIEGPKTLFPGSFGLVSNPVPKNRKARW